MQRGWKQADIYDLLNALRAAVGEPALEDVTAAPSASSGPRPYYRVVRDRVAAGAEHARRASPRYRRRLKADLAVAEQVGMTRKRGRGRRPTVKPRVR